MCLPPPCTGEANIVHYHFFFKWFNFKLQVPPFLKVHKVWVSLNTIIQIVKLENFQLNHIGKLFSLPLEN